MKVSHLPHLQWLLTNPIVTLKWKTCNKAGSFLYYKMNTFYSFFAATGRISAWEAKTWTEWLNFWNWQIKWYICPDTEIVLFTTKPQDSFCKSAFWGKGKKDCINYTWWMTWHSLGAMMKMNVWELFLRGCIVLQSSMFCLIF